MQTNFISVKAAVHEFRRFTGIEGELNKSDLIAFANDALDRILTAEQFKHKILLIPVENYKAELPPDFKYICQVAYRQTCPEGRNTRFEITEFTKNILGSDCDLKINVECPKCSEFNCNCKTDIIEVNVDRIFELNNPQLTVGYMDHFYGYGTMDTGQKSSIYHPEFQLIRKTTSSFFNVPYHIGECVNLNLDCNIEYTIDLPNLIINVKSGEILLSYFGFPLDEEGYRLMPNDATVIKAVSYALAERYLYQEYLKTYDQNKRLAWQLHVQESEKWTARAAARLRTPEFDDLHSFMTGFIHRVVPKYNYWEDLMRRRGDSFKYPGETYNLKGYRR
jgi:hypothetical protein